MLFSHRLLQDAKQYCREIMSAVRQLRQKRDMSINEIKLTLAIEDPTTREKRDYLGIEVGPPAHEMEGRLCQ